MKRIAALLLGAILLVPALCLHFIPASADGNVTMIDDFESGGISDGYFLSGFSAQAYDNTVYKNGAKSLKLENIGTAGAVSAAYPEVHSAANNHNFSATGKTLFQFWIKTASLPADVAFGFQIHLKTGATTWVTTSDPILNSNNTNSAFTLFSIPLNSFKNSGNAFNPETNTPVTGFIFVPMNPSATAYTIWLDDIALVKPTVEYTVTFDSDGGSAVAAQTVAENTKATKPADPAKDGCDFVEWQYDDGGVMKAFNFATMDITANITLKAKWQVRPAGTSRVTFDSNGGSAVAHQDVTNGGKAAKPADPTRSGYNFVEWQYDDGGVMKAFDFDAMTVTANITLKAKWDMIIPGAPVPDTTGFVSLIQGFESAAAGGDAVGGFLIENAACGSVALETDADKVYNGSKALRMDLNGSMAYIGANALNGGLGDVNMRGYTHLEVWIKTNAPTVYPFPLRIRFLSAESTWYAATRQLHLAHTNEDYVQVRIPLEEFKAAVSYYDPVNDSSIPWQWQIDMDCNTGDTYSIWLDNFALVNINGEVDLTEKYTVSFNSLGGSLVPDQEVKEGEKAVKPADPARKGYEFVRWQIADGYDDEGDAVYKTYDFDAPVTKDIVLRALWKLEGEPDPTDDGDGGDGGKSPVTGGASPVWLGLALALPAAGMAMAARKKRRAQ